MQNTRRTKVIFQSKHRRYLQTWARI